MEKTLCLYFFINISLTDIQTKAFEIIFQAPLLILKKFFKESFLKENRKFLIGNFLFTS